MNIIITTISVILGNGIENIFEQIIIC